MNIVTRRYNSNYSVKDIIVTIIQLRWRKKEIKKTKKNVYDYKVKMKGQQIWKYSKVY